MHETLAARVAKVGEAYKYHSETDELHAKLRALMFAEIEDLGPRQIAEHTFRPEKARCQTKGDTSCEQQN